ncbi:hypothetical protein R1sor_024317 [Riccia sorocarpa]|uniref:Uncharacterized protein n=1 Tax=Riccia sorocarpa TaxID=122646 RepID=A0ABD3GS16_9MARC
MQRKGKSKLPTRQLPPKPYHLVRDRKGRRVILCAIGDCVEVFSEIPGYNNHDTVGNCLDFIRLRGTLAARWRISKRRKFKRLFDRAMEFKDNRSAIKGTTHTDKLEFEVQKSYRQWKQQQKPANLARLRSNLMATLMRQYNLSEEEAEVQGGLNEEIIDTSDDEP